MEPDLHVLPGPSARVQRTLVGTDSVGPGPGPRGREPVPRRGQNTENPPRQLFSTLYFQLCASLLCAVSIVTILEQNVRRGQGGRCVDEPLEVMFVPVRLQVLVELDSALLDDQPHWYKLQLHDVSSLPLPNASPYLQRRVLQPEDALSSRRLQSETHARAHRHMRTLF